MAKIGIGERLRMNSEKSLIFSKEYKKARLDPRALIPSEHNTYSQENIEELADNMLLVGQLQEIIVGRVNGQDRIIVGHRRTAAAVLNIERGHEEFKLVDCKIREMSESLFMLTLHSANIFNRQLSDWELTNGVAEFTKYLEKAREAGEVTIEGKMRDYIANATGKSTGKINQINSINNNLCEEGKEAFKDGKINFSTAYETSRLTEEKQKEVIENGGLLSSEVKQMVKEEKQKKEPTEEEVRRFYEGKVRKYDTDRKKLKEICIEKFGRSHNGGSGGTAGDYMCSPRDVKIESAEEITWARFVQLINEYYPVDQKPKPGDDYEPAHPESVTSLCYSCQKYSVCNVKTGTCQKCDQYINKTEAEKTDEQRYDEQQAAMDRETKAKLRQQSEEKKMEKLPSEAAAAEPKTHIIRLAAMNYDDVVSGKKSFEICKDAGYKEGDRIEYMEFRDGRNTGREIKAEIVYVLKEHSGLTESWCILGIKVRAEEKKDEDLPGQMQLKEYLETEKENGVRI